MAGKLKWVGIAIFGVVALGAGAFWWFGPRSEVIRLPGTVETQEVRLSSRTGGRVEKIAIREGDLVKPGQPLVYLEMPELKAQRDQVAARLLAAEAMLEKARAGARTEEKAAALAGMQATEARLARLKSGFRVEEVEQARFDVATAEADLARNAQELEREKALMGGASSKSNYDTAVANYKRLQAQTRAAQARLKMLVAGTRPEDIAEAEAELARMKAQYQLLEAGNRSEDIAEADAKVAELRGRLREMDVNLAELVVRAPEQALVEVLAVRPGDVVAANQPLVRVLRTDDLWVKAFVSEIDLGRIRLNQTVEVTVDAYKDRRFQGVVTWIASISEFTPRNVQSIDERRHQVFAIKVRVDDPQGVFKSGMAADVILMGQ